MRFLVAMMCIASLSGCATAYGDMGFTGGVAADQITSTRFRISARGNGYTDTRTIQDYAMRKAAETTIEHGYEWFGVVQESDRSGSSLQSFTSPTTTYGSVSGYGSTATFNATTYGGQTTYMEVFKPGQDLMIEIGRGPRPAGAYDAAETLRYVLPRTER